MTSVKRTLEDVGQGFTSDLSKTERRRLAKKAKKERERKGGAAAGKGGVPMTAGRKGSPKRGPKPKMTKEERRAKYTQMAYEARERRNQLGPGANKTRCLGCRAWGHIVANCPEAKVAIGVCFNCGSSKHALRVCPQPRQKDGSLPHATCFVCKGKGHVSAHCKQNANGIYPKGGFCKECGSKHHLSWNCPDSTKVDKKSTKTVVGVPDGESSEDRENESAVPRGGGGGTGGQAAILDGRAVAAGGTAATGASKAQGGKAGNSKASRARGADSTATPAPLPGGDDLEDDGYFDPEDVPEPAFEDDGTADQADGRGPVTGRGKPARAAGAASKKQKSKVVVF